MVTKVGKVILSIIIHFIKSGPRVVQIRLLVVVSDLIQTSFILQLS